ncbi:MAG: hypothetical protein K6E30_05575 [Lachnospiraceae bacterium]|nr:hypothetical protein [Lachnospiraceae bacterium]
MQAEKLAERLKKIYWSANRTDTVVSIILFGIANAEQIKESGLAPLDLTRKAGIPDGYAAELRKGMRVSRYVELKKSVTE